jgi:CBS-domain-containing membrane protein
MRVGNAMTPDLITVTPETSVHKAAALMGDHGVSGLPVVDGEGRLLGLVSEGDLILRQATPHPKRWWHRFVADPESLAREYRKAKGTTVAEVMTRAVVSVGPEMALTDAARILYDRGLRRLPVVHDGRLVGILSRADVVKTVAMTPPVTTAASDNDLLNTMRQRMAAEMWTSPGVVVEASYGVITLRGVVASDAERSALGTMARAIPGCRAVENRLAAGVGIAYHYGD